MAKLAVVIEETQTLDFNFASNPTIMNVSDSPLYVLGPDEEKTVDGLDIPTRNKVMAALYAVRPGETRVIGKGVFKIILGVFCSAFLSYGGKIQTPKDDDETETTTPTATDPTTPTEPEPTTPTEPEPTTPAE